jgi:hypothetical protein
MLAILWVGISTLPVEAGVASLRSSSPVYATQALSFSGASDIKNTSTLLRVLQSVARPKNAMAVGAFGVGVSAWLFPNLLRELEWGIALPFLLGVVQHPSQDPDDVLTQLRNPPPEVANPSSYNAWKKAGLRSLVDRAVAIWGSWPKVLAQLGVTKTVQPGKIAVYATQDAVLAKLRNPPPEVRYPNSSRSWREAGYRTMVDAAGRLWESGWAGAIAAADLEKARNQHSPRRYPSESAVFKQMMHPPGNVKNPFNSAEWERAGYETLVVTARLYFNDWRSMIEAYKDYLVRLSAEDEKARAIYLSLKDLPAVKAARPSKYPTRRDVLRVIWESSHTLRNRFERKRWQRADRRYVDVVHQYFGSWENMLDVARSYPLETPESLLNLFMQPPALVIDPHLAMAWVEVGRADVVEAALAYFSSWENAAKTAGLDPSKPRRSRVYRSREDVLRVAWSPPEGVEDPFNAEDWKLVDAGLPLAARTYFGSWINLVEVARRHPLTSAADVIEILQHPPRQIKAAWRSQSWRDIHRGDVVKAAYEFFPSWIAATQAAGIHRVNRKVVAVLKPRGILRTKEKFSASSVQESRRKARALSRGPWEAQYEDWDKIFRIAPQHVDRHVKKAVQAKERLSEIQIQQIALEVRRGNEAARQVLFLASQRWARVMVQKFLNHQPWFESYREELVNVALFGVYVGHGGLWRAIELYDPTRGVKLATYAGYYVRAALRRYVAQLPNNELPLNVDLPIQDVFATLMDKHREEGLPALMEYLETHQMILSPHLDVDEVLSLLRERGRLPAAHLKSAA